MKKLLACLLILCMISAIICACDINAGNVTITNQSTDEATGGETTTVAPDGGNGGTSSSDNGSNNSSNADEGGSGNTSQGGNSSGNNSKPSGTPEEDNDNIVHAHPEWFDK